MPNQAHRDDGAVTSNASQNSPVYSVPPCFKDFDVRLCSIRVHSREFAAKFLSAMICGNLRREDVASLTEC
jgi:hypothetical protein